MKNWQMREKLVAADQGLSQGTLRMSTEQWGQTKWKWAWSSYLYKNLDCRWVETLRYWAMRKADRLNWTQTSMICCNSFLFIWEKLAMASVTIVILKGKLLNEEILTWGHYTGSDNRLWVWGSYYTEAFSIAGSVLTSEGGDVIVRWGLVREAERSSLLIQDL